MDLSQILRGISVVVLPMLLALTVPEIARGRVALALGDPTPGRGGRMSLNPLSYVDPLGTVILPTLMYVLGVPLLFGWAKPIAIDLRNFRNPRRDLAILSAAGPLASLLMAIGWALAGKSLASHGLLGNGTPAYWVVEMAQRGIPLNVFLAAINFLPIPPFAGGRVLIGILPLKAARRLASIEPYGVWIVLALLFLESSHLISIFMPFVIFLNDLIISIVP